MRRLTALLTICAAACSPAILVVEPTGTVPATGTRRRPARPHAAGTASQPTPTPAPDTCQKFDSRSRDDPRPWDVPTLDGAAAAARPGAVILLDLVTYPGALIVPAHRPGITIRGVDRNEVVFDGETCARTPSRSRPMA